MTLLWDKLGRVWKWGIWIHGIKMWYLVKQEVELQSQIILIKYFNKCLPLSFK